MLRAFLRLFSSTPQPLKPIQSDRSAGPNVVLYAHVDANSPHASASKASKSLSSGSERVNHRARLMSMKLEHTRLCSAKRCERLRELGIVTAGDMATSDPKVVAEGFAATRKAAAVLKQYRRAIRLAAGVPGMMPRDAQLLISIHRRSVRGLARETPHALYRDLQRYAESSSGRQQLRGRRLPSTRRIKRWIAACEMHVGGGPVHVTAA